MNETISEDGTRPRAFANPSGPDLSRLPAYVEPPRVPQAGPDRPSRNAVLALTGTAFGSALLLGWYVYANQPVPSVVASVPSQPQPAHALQASASPQDVPLPDGAHFVSTAGGHSPAALGRTLHPPRLPRPSRG